MNTSGALVMRSENGLARPPCSRRSMQMVAMAQRSRAPMQRMADQVADYFVVGVVGIALLTLCLGLLRSRPLGLRPDQCRGGAHHRLSLRVGLATPCRSWSRPDAGDQRRAVPRRCPTCAKSTR